MPSNRDGTFFQKDPTKDLVKAVEIGDLKTVKSILEKYPTMAHKVIELGEGKDDTTLLYLAVEHSQPQVAYYLLTFPHVGVKRNGHDIRIDAENKHTQKNTDASREVCEVLDGAQHKKLSQQELPGSKTFRGKA
ncbi:MAG TPA: hypothetical protein VGV92_08695 [Gammaproteobacteria bacterium]|nr:hypothetical protein [Gammaproteobacteria bacterium]